MARNTSTLRFNPETGMVDVYTLDHALIGAVPNTTAGINGAADALIAYALFDIDTDATQLKRLRAARRVVVIVGGTPNTPRLRHEGESWSTSVMRHQRQLALAHAEQSRIAQARLQERAV